MFCTDTLYTPLHDRYLLMTLSDENVNSAALAVVNRTAYPSYGYMLGKGTIYPPLCALYSHISYSL